LITLSEAVPGDVPAIAELAAEMDRFYGATELDPVEIRQRQIEAALFTGPSAARALLAWDDGRLIGFAAYSFLWPAVGLTSSLYLKELYVSAAARRAGAGEMLMRGLFEIAVRAGCSRVEWTTDEGNGDAQAFYEALGVRPATSKIFYRIEGEALAAATRLPHRAV
jgi:ribosomal protein S18 acetylase RimI-like enzyme